VQSRQPPPDRLRNSAGLLRRCVHLEFLTLGWTSIGAAVMLFAAVAAYSPALTGFGLVFLIETFASSAVIWDLMGKHQDQRPRVRRLIGYAFLALVMLLLTQSMWVLTGTTRPQPSNLGLGWLAASSIVMLLLARNKRVTGQRLGNPILLSAAAVATRNAMLAGTVFVGLAANATFGWWWADPAAALMVVAYGLQGGLTALD
jgi:hypothetical protein